MWGGAQLPLTCPGTKTKQSKWALLAAGGMQAGYQARIPGAGVEEDKILKEEEFLSGWAGSRGRWPISKGVGRGNMGP